MFRAGNDPSPLRFSLTHRQLLTISDEIHDAPGGSRVQNGSSSHLWCNFRVRIEWMTTRSNISILFSARPRFAQFKSDCNSDKMNMHLLPTQASSVFTIARVRRDDMADIHAPVNNSKGLMTSES
jgi:hypothetical protein